jgi:hypothetical protein
MVHAMYGYIFAALAGLICLFSIIAALGQGRAPDRRKNGSSRPEKPLQAEKPAADEPTPSRSSVASPRQIESASRHTPPA